MGRKGHTGAVKTDEIAQENELLSLDRRTTSSAVDCDITAAQNLLEHLLILRKLHKAKNWPDNTGYMARPLLLF